jgi:hypothetical protein
MEEEPATVRPVRLARPPKPVSKMTNAELDAWAETVWQEFVRRER